MGGKRTEQEAPKAQLGYPLVQAETWSTGTCGSAQLMSGG